MAAAGGLRRILLRSSIPSPKVSNGGFVPLSSLSSSSSSSSASEAPAFVRLSRRKLPLGISRVPVELGCVQSLMPLHSVTASALLISKLSTKPGGWAWLSEGFATPL